MARTLQAHNTDHVERFQSRLGHRFDIRRIAPADVAALAAFVEGLSPRSRRLRFFTPLTHLEPAQLERFANVDFQDRAAFVATPEDAKGIVAVGRYDRTATDLAEVAFAVADAHQGEGICTELLHHLAAHARLNGITTFTAYVLLENQEMFEVFRNSGYPMSAENESGVSLVTLSLV